MIGSVGRFADDEIPLPAAEVGSAREFFALWKEEIAASS
jgi:hypothetical protein